MLSPIESGGSWVPDASGTGFPLENLPYGSFSTLGTTPRPGSRIGDFVLDLRAAAAAGLLEGTAPDPRSLFAGPQLTELMAAGRPTWERVRARLVELLAVDAAQMSDVEPLLTPIGDVRLHLPFAVADYIDFYSCQEHATNLGRLFRPEGQPLLPNWHHLPVGYHGRSGTFLVSGTQVPRPMGQRLDPSCDRPVFGPSTRLDFELEVGFVVGAPSPMNSPVRTSAAGRHLFGIVLLNDWSARDIQAWEYQPLGPHLGKSFATSISPWVIPLDALEPYRVPGVSQDPPVHDYLRVQQDWAFDLTLEVMLRSEQMAGAGTPAQLVSRVGFRHVYWNAAQHVAHVTINGAGLRTGDVHASGTVSGRSPSELGSMIEMTENGARPLPLADGMTRAFLHDGDSVTISGSAGPLSLGTVEGTITPAISPDKELC